MALIVVLEDSNAVVPALAHEQAAPGSEDHRPCFDAPVGVLCWVWSGRVGAFDFFTIRSFDIGFERVDEFGGVIVGVKLVTVGRADGRVSVR